MILESTEQKSEQSSLPETIRSNGSNSWWAEPRWVQLLSDVFALTMSFFLYQLVRQWVIVDATFTRYSAADVTLVCIVTCSYWVLVLWFGGLYKNYYARSPFEEFFAVLRYTFFGSALFFVFIFLSSSEQFQRSPRFIFFVYWIITAVLMVCGRYVARRIQRYMREKGIVRVPTILLGTASRVGELFKYAVEEKVWGYLVVGGVIVNRENEMFSPPSRMKLLGDSSSLIKILELYRPKEVLISVANVNHSELLQITTRCIDSGARVKIVPDLYEIFSGQARTQQIHGTPLIEVSPELMQPWEIFVKRFLDITISVIVLLGGLPVWLLTALVVKLSSNGPVFFIQQRVGRNGVVFPMYKYRSMVTDRDREPSWTSRNDPRVTPLGRFLRKSHLDEIPQLLNVLYGQMSLVGPRPEVPHFVNKYSAILPYYKRRLKVRPGITGWWQVKSKSNDESLEEIEQRLRYDFFYIENISFKLDLEILVRTIFVMMKGHGKA